MKRTLTLRRETLTELCATDLEAVVGAAAGLSGRTCPAAVCVDLSRLFQTCDGCATAMC